MTDVDFKKMILSNELQRCKRHVGTELVNAIDEENFDYAHLLNDVMKHLDSCIDLLSFKENKE